MGLLKSLSFHLFPVFLQSRFGRKYGSISQPSVEKRREIFPVDMYQYHQKQVYRCVQNEFE